ncbi:hypothetical protein XmelCFBP4644_16165 [Xanthomonas melonis]|uniref:Uncharacterized protein n=1 Tax=Xanthomonas melonis TaxID=56456 RepID=A0A2S7DCI6_9XANT|nr:hypothetical protein XmelCFBP4644_16165 [Xanthomonas melonis]
MSSKPLVRCCDASRSAAVLSEAAQFIEPAQKCKHFLHRHDIAAMMRADHVASCTADVSMSAARSLVRSAQPPRANMRPPRHTP